MSYNRTLNVLNTVAINGTDVSTDSNGVVTFSGGSIPQVTVKAKNITGITKIASVAETKEVYTITPTYVASAVYTLVVQGYSTADGSQLTMKFSVTADSATTTPTLICNAFRTQINAVGAPLNIVTSGTSTLIFTASGIGSTGYTQLACFSVGSPDTSNMTVVNGTDGVPCVGTVGALSASNGGKYALAQSNIQGGYAALSNLSSGQVYTEWDIDYNVYAPTGDGINFTVVSTRLVLLVQEGVTNISDLQGTYGTLTGLKSGKATTIVAVTTVAEKAAAITVTTGTVTLSGSSAPTFYSEGINVGDVVNIGSVYTNIMDIGTIIATPQVTGLGDYVSAVSAAAYRIVQYRPFGN